MLLDAKFVHDHDFDQYEVYSNMKLIDSYIWYYELFLSCLNRFVKLDIMDCSFFCGVFCISGLDCVGVPWQKPLYLVFLSLNRNDNTEQDVKAGMLSIGSIAVTKFEIVSWETSADLAIVVVTVEFTSISSAFKLCVFSTYPNETVTFRCSAELFPQG